MRSFRAADLNAKGELIQSAEYDYTSLEQIPGAADLITQFATLIWREPDQFDTPMPSPHEHIAWRWRASAATSGIGTLRTADGPIGISIFATGLNEQHDRVTLLSLQQHLIRQLHDTGNEPAFDITCLVQRPMVATVNLFDPASRADLPLIALADRCFAAAYFRYHSLV